MRGIQISTLSVSAFRGISDLAIFDLRAPLTLVFAPNGAGKTTMCEAAEWLLTGQVERLKDGKDFDAKVLRSKFGKEGDSPSVAAELLVGGKGRFLSRYADGSQSSVFFGENHPSSVQQRPHELLSMLAPTAAANEAHHLTAINLRQRWLKGTRFLSSEALAALVDTDEDTIERRAQIFADLLGIRHLLDAERQCEKYSAELSSRLRSLSRLTEQQLAEVSELEKALSGRDTDPDSRVSARSEADAAAKLLNSEELDDSQGNLDARLESLTAIQRRQRHALDLTAGLAQELDARWHARQTLEQAVLTLTTLEASLTRTLEEIEEMGRLSGSRVAELTAQRDLATETAQRLAAGKERLATLASALLSAVNNWSGVSGRAMSMTDLSDELKEWQWTLSARDQRRRELTALRAALDASVGEDARLKFLDEDILKRREALSSEEEFALLRREAADADDRAAAAGVAFVNATNPIARLQAAARELLDHEHALSDGQCPVCSHDWGTIERLRAAIADALASGPVVAQALSLAAAAATEAATAARRKLEAVTSARDQVQALQRERDSLVRVIEQHRAEITRLGLPTQGARDETSRAILRLEAASAFADFSKAWDELASTLPNDEAPLLQSDAPLSELLDQIERSFAAKEQAVQLRLAGLVSAIEVATQDRNQLRSRHAGTQQQLKECRVSLQEKTTELSGLRRVWARLVDDRELEWSDPKFAEVKQGLADHLRRLARVEAHIEAAREAWSSEARRERLKDLQKVTAPLLLRQKRMTDRIAAANRARAVFQQAYSTISRTQVEDLSRVVNPLFARMHANRVFDRINLGEGGNFLHWLADAGGQRMDPSRDFSQGQRQDLALALFLARARTLGGTFFLDEPVVHLDDLNRVGLLDILRAIVLEGSESLNLVITTSSRSLARHLIEKFVGIGTVETAFGPSHPLRVLELDGNGRTGVQLRSSYPLH